MSNKRSKLSHKQRVTELTGINLAAIKKRLDALEMAVGILTECILFGVSTPKKKRKK